MKHTAIYLRVSSKQRDHASQLPDLERWVAAQDGPVQWYKDKFTGKTMDRPGIEKLLADLRAGKVERIVVWRLDRLGRTTRGLCQLFDELTERKVARSERDRSGLGWLGCFIH
ncbi:MAG: recombinase family protein [Thermoguttaceae bacterium]|jgi:DNA invertase Pin-like site-specific DNA recombinase